MLKPMQPPKFTHVQVLNSLPDVGYSKRHLPAASIFPHIARTGTCRFHSAPFLIQLHGLRISHLIHFRSDMWQQLRPALTVLIMDLSPFLP